MTIRHTLSFSTLCLVLLVACTPASAPMPGSSSATTAAVSVGEVPEEEGSGSAAASQQNANGAENSVAAAEPTTQVSTEVNQEPERISFDDLNCNIQANLVFRDWMLTDRAKELDGQRVRLAGYMLADLKTEGIEEFVLLKNTECKFGPDGQADHLALIKLVGDETAKFTDKPIDVIGTLHYKPFTGIDGFTWAIYEIEAEAVRPMRR